MIQIKGLTKSLFGGGHKVDILKGIDLTIPDACRAFAMRFLLILTGRNLLPFANYSGNLVALQPIRAALVIRL